MSTQRFSKSSPSWPCATSRNENAALSFGRRALAGVWTPRTLSHHSQALSPTSNTIIKSGWAKLWQASPQKKQESLNQVSRLLLQQMSRKHSESSEKPLAPKARLSQSSALRKLRVTFSTLWNCRSLALTNDLTQHWQSPLFASSRLKSQSVMQPFAA